MGVLRRACRGSLAHDDLEVPVETGVASRAPWREIPSLKLIDAPLGRVQQRIRRILSGPGPAGELAPLLGSLTAQTGKMIRPSLVLLAGRCFGPTSDRHIEVSAIVEMLHNATLLHDDVIDEGQTRRGVPTVNRVWGNESAVLLGDFLLSQVFRLTASLDPAVAGVIGETAARVCEGELRQVAQKQNWQLTEAEYLDIVTEKSAAFFSGCCRLGAMLSDAAESQIEALAAYGLHAGVAFQIADDLLDIAGDENTTGKTARSDLSKSKLTLAMIRLLDTVDASTRQKVHILLANPAESANELERMLTAHGSLPYARDRALDYVRLAETALQSLPATDAKDALIQTAHFLASRTA